MSKELKEIFRSVVKGVNLMTPDVEEYGRVGRYIYELSTGRAFDRIIYGVTVVEVKEGGVETTNLSRCFFSKEDVMQYLDYLAYLAAKSTTQVSEGE